MDTNFYKKYLKYKQKYLDLKEQIGGSANKTALALNPERAIALKKYNETMFNSANKELQEIIGQVLEGKIGVNDEISGLVTTNNWAKFDEYIKSNPGVINFYKLFQQLFLLYNSLKVISRKQYQISLGIQQVRWMVDDENCKKMKNYDVKNAIFFTWEDIPEKERYFIQNEIYNQIKGRLNNPSIKKDLNGHYDGSIWYKVKTTNSVGWPGFGSEEDFFPISETINFTKIACIYCPVLIFGSLSDQSLLKYIILHKERPYAMHFPTSKSNLWEVHGNKHMIVANWRHDFTHSRSGWCDTGFDYVNEYCKTYVNKYNILEAIQNNDSYLSKCIYDKTEINRGEERGTEIARVVNDTGRLWSNPPLPVVLGGARGERFI